MKRCGVLQSVRVASYKCFVKYHVMLNYHLSNYCNNMEH